MLKKLGLTTTISLVLIGLIPTVGGADPRPTFAYPNTNLNDSTLFCYMQTADGRMLDLRRLCGTPTNNNQTNNNRTNNSQMSPESIQAPLPALPQAPPGDLSNLNGTEQNGETPPCFIFDVQGRPCAAQS